MTNARIGYDYRTVRDVVVSRVPEMLPAAREREADAFYEGDDELRLWALIGRDLWQELVSAQAAGEAGAGRLARVAGLVEVLIRDGDTEVENVVVSEIVLRIRAQKDLRRSLSEHGFDHLTRGWHASMKWPWQTS